MKKATLGFLLIKEGHTSVEEIIILKKRKEWQEIKTKECRIFTKIGIKKQPESQQIYELLTGAHITKVLNQSFSFCIFFKLQGRMFCCYQGHSGSHLVDKSYIEKSFPIDSALKLLKQTNLREVELVGPHKRRVKSRFQTPENGDQLVVYIDTITDLVNAVTGHVEIDDQKSTIHAGQNSLRTSIEPNLSKIMNRAAYFLNIFLDKNRKKVIETSLKNYTGSILEIESYTLGKIKSLSPEVGMSLPFLEIYGDISFRYEINGKTFESSGFSLKSYLTYRDEQVLTINNLKQDKIYIIMNGNICADPLSLWSCIEFTGYYNDQLIYLSDGIVRTVEDTLVTYLHKWVDAVPRNDDLLPVAKCNEDENIYANRVGIKLKNTKILDRINVSFGGGRSKVELCDFIVDGRLGFLKPLTDKKGTATSASVSYLLWQIELSINLLTKSPDFRKAVKANRRIIKEGLEIDNSFFENKQIVLGLISSRVGPLSSILPFPAIMGLHEFWRRMQSKNISIEICIIHRPLSIHKSPKDQKKEILCEL